eukprot:TRINITY_DN11881_c0_g1_i1.p1 TRINITY_DN11881_c0_g1~~TRINITY_DN11881_c0_g1_i1.p1  ORF type:complete len:144 (+),score=43.07 TRINITY_DN11881_c0_g1_i1:350-781(+)
MCSKPLTGEHLLVEGTDGKEVPVHEECYMADLPVCAWCRVQIQDSYTLFKTLQGKVVQLHEKCVRPFESSNSSPTAKDGVKSLSRPSEQRAAGRDGDRLFITSMSVRELKEELARRDVATGGCVEKGDLERLLRDAWDWPVVR